MDTSKSNLNPHGGNSDWSLWIKLVKAAYKEKGINLTQPQALIIGKGSYPGKGNVIGRESEHSIPVLEKSQVPPNPVRRKQRSNDPYEREPVERNRERRPELRPERRPDERNQDRRPVQRRPVEPRPVEKQRAERRPQYYDYDRQGEEYDQYDERYQEEQPRYINNYDYDQYYDHEGEYDDYE